MNLKRDTAPQPKPQAWTFVPRPRQHLEVWQRGRTLPRPAPKLVFRLSASQSMEFPLAGENVRLGRSAANNIVIDNSWISSFHAEFQLCPDGTAELRDLGSTNGTTVNGRRVERARLRPGDRVGFGGLEALYEYAGTAGVPPREKPEGTPLRSPLAGGAPRLSRPEPTQPVPEPGLAGMLPPRATVPRGFPYTAPLVPRNGESRRESERLQAEIAALREERVVLALAVESLRREHEAGEQQRIWLRLQGERELRELNIRLGHLRDEVTRAEDQTAPVEARQPAAGMPEWPGLQEFPGLVFGSRRGTVPGIPRTEEEGADMPDQGLRAMP